MEVVMRSNCKEKEREGVVEQYLRVVGTSWGAA